VWCGYSEEKGEIGERHRDHMVKGLHPQNKTVDFILVCLRKVPEGFEQSTLTAV
jgi:hypothetical protein